MSEVHERIRRLIDKSGKTYAEASRDSGLSESQVSSMLRKEHHSPSIATVQKLAKGLDTTPEWIAFGINKTNIPDGHLLLSESLLRQVLDFVLVHEGVDAERAAALADILPAALAGPPVDAVGGDPFLTFQVHFQFPEKRCGR